MRLRAVREADHGPVVSVVDGWWDERPMAQKLPRLFFRHFGDTSFIAEDDGALVGFLLGFVSQSAIGEAYVHFVGVHPEYRARGVGRRLYGAFFEEARRRECDTVRCITSPTNRDSIAFHARMGFEILAGDGEADGVSFHTDYDGEGEDRVLFSRTLG